MYRSSTASRPCSPKRLLSSGSFKRISASLNASLSPGGNRSPQSASWMTRLISTHALATTGLPMSMYWKSLWDSAASVWTLRIRGRMHTSLAAR